MNDARTPGWYPDPEQRGSAATERYWTGSAWPTALDQAERRAALASRVAKWVKAGYRVESQTDDQAVLVRGRRPNHLLHLVLSLLTLGIWALFVWLPLAIFGGEKRKIVSVTPDGHAIES